MIGKKPDPLDELESLLPHLTPDEVRQAELLLTPTRQQLLDSLPDNVLNSLLVASQKYTEARGGREPDDLADLLPHVPADLRGPLEDALRRGAWPPGITWTPAEPQPSFYLTYKVRTP
jgi:hypothetical protein